MGIEDDVGVDVGQPGIVWGRGIAVAVLVPQEVKRAGLLSRGEDFFPFY